MYDKRKFECILYKNSSSLCCYHIRALTRNLKLMMFSPNQEIRLVFSKGHHHALQQKTRKHQKTLFQERNVAMYDIIQHKKITTEKCFLLYHKLGWDMEQKQFIKKQIGVNKIKVGNKYCRWVHMSVRSVENCSSLGIFNASVTALQAIMQLCSYKSCDYAIINYGRYYFK